MKVSDEPNSYGLQETPIYNYSGDTEIEEDFHNGWYCVYLPNEEDTIPEYGPFLGKFLFLTNLWVSIVTTAAPVLSTAFVMKDLFENKLTSLIFGLLNGYRLLLRHLWVVCEENRKQIVNRLDKTKKITFQVTAVNDFKTTSGKFKYLDLPVC